MSVALAIVWGAVRKNITSDSTKTAISAHI